MLFKEFDQACQWIIGNQRNHIGIGTLGEKTLHAVLKYTFEPDDQYHEIKVGSYFADIKKNQKIIEIQTRNFNALRNKLTYFLENNFEVTIVYPIPHRKWLIWIDLETQEETKKRKSPKIGTVFDAFPELYKIKAFLIHPNLKMTFVLLDISEYRNLDGWSQDKKKGSSRYERIPQFLIDVIQINDVEDYTKLIPKDLEEKFTAKDFKSASGLNLKNAQTALNVLKYVGAVKVVDKQKNAFIYETNSYQVLSQEK